MNISEVVKVRLYLGRETYPVFIGPTGEQLKVCSKCRLEKTLGCFRRETRTTIGFQSVCIDCNEARRQERYYANHETYKQKAAQKARATRLRSPDAARARDRKYYATHRPQVLAAARRYAARHHAKVLERSRAYYYATKPTWSSGKAAAVAAYQQEYRRQNYDRLRVHDKARREANLEYARLKARCAYRKNAAERKRYVARYQREHPLAVGEYGRKYRASKKHRDTQRIYRKINGDRLRDKSREWTKRNPERAAESSSATAKRSARRLDHRYVVSQIIKRTSLRRSQVPIELVKAKRAHLRAMRALGNWRCLKTQEVQYE